MIGDNTPVGRVEAALHHTRIRLIRDNYEGLKAGEIMARAAIEALREPTEAMINRCIDQSIDKRGASFESTQGARDFVAALWSAMIDEALK